jgi:hypothetical protein
MAVPTKVAKAIVLTRVEASWTRAMATSLLLFAAAFAGFFGAGIGSARLVLQKY